MTLIDGANFGLMFESWLGYGCLFSAIAFVFVYIIYELFIRKALCKRELIFLSEKEKRIVRYNNILLKRVLAVSISIALVLGVATIVLNTISEQSSKPKEIKIDKSDKEDVYKITLKSSPTAMLFWAMQYADECEVLAPESLRDRIIETLSRAKEKYLKETEK